MDSACYWLIGETRTLGETHPDTGRNMQTTQTRTLTALPLCLYRPFCFLIVLHLLMKYMVLLKIIAVLDDSTLKY